MIINYSAWLIFGGLIGLITSHILPPQSEDQSKVDVVIGAAGAFGTGILMQLLVRYQVQEFNLSVLIITILGAMVALATHKTFVRT